MGLEEARKKIDKIDKELVSLLNERAALAKQTAGEKEKLCMPVYSQGREKEVIENAIRESKGSFPKEALPKIFTEIMSACRSCERKMCIAFLGPETTFTHMAAMKKFGSSSEFVARDSIPEIFSAVEKGEAEFGVVPVENSLEGSVVSTFDMFLDSELNIVAEIMLDIKQDLLAKCALEEIKKVFSHPQAFAQCRKWLDKNLPKVELVEASSTASAAQQAALQKNSAAIASSLAAEAFGLEVLKEGIQDSVKNKTRFLVIGKTKPKKTSSDKTSILFSVKHEPGTLFEALSALKKHNVNMTKIESRPSKQKLWEVVFFIDFEGFVEQENVQKALAEMKEKCLFLRVLGSYPEEVSVSE